MDSALRPWRISAVAAAGTPLAATSTVWSKVTDFDQFSFPLTIRVFTGLGSDSGPGCATTGGQDTCIDLAYDPYERLQSIKTLDASNNPCSGLACSTSYGYDGDGQRVSSASIVNGRSVTTALTLDALERVIKIIDRNGGQTTLGYDENDKLVWRRDAADKQNGGTGNRLATFLYDDFGNPVQVVNPDIGTWTSSFDAAGNITASQDGAGEQLAYKYDLLNRQTTVQSVAISPGTYTVTPEISFKYDETGQMPLLPGSTFANTQGRLSSISAGNANGSPVNHNFSYDFRGFRTAEVEDLVGSGNAISTAASVGYAWDPAISRTPRDHLPGRAGSNTSISSYLWSSINYWSSRN